MVLGAPEDFYILGNNATKVASDGTDVFVGSNAGNVYKIETLATPATDSILNAGRDPEYVAYHDGVLYKVETQGAGSTPKGVYSVNTSTGAETLVCTVTQLNTPWAVAIRPSDGSFWVTGYEQGLVEFNSSGTHVATHLGPAGADLGGGVWVDDVLYIMEIGNGSIVSFDPSTDAFTTVISDLYNLDETLWPGEDLAHHDGRLYTSVRRFAAGDYHVWSCAIDGTDQIAEYTDTTTPGVLGLTVIDGYLYGANPSNGYIVRWQLPCTNFDFTSPEIAYEYPSGALEDYPLQVLDHSDGVVHVTYKGIKHISASGVLTWWTAWAGNRNSYAHGFLLDDNHVILEGAIWDNGTRDNTSLNDYNTYVASPYCTIQAPDGSMWVVDDSRWIWQFDASGNLLKEINGNEFTGLGTTIPDGNVGLFLDGDLLYVAAWDGVFVADITTMTQPYPGADPDYWVLQFDRLFNSSSGTTARLESGICVYGGKVYFTDWGSIGVRSTRILSLNPSGGTDQTATVEYEANVADGTQNANFQNITVIAGDLYVASESDLRVYRFATCCWNWVDLGALPKGADFGVVVSSYKVFYSIDGDSTIYVASYPDLTSLHTLTIPSGRWVADLALDAAGGTLYALTVVTATKDNEVWAYNVSNPSDTGTLIAAWTPVGTSTLDSHYQIVWNPIDGLLYTPFGVAGNDVTLYSIDPSTGTVTAVHTWSGAINNLRISVGSDGVLWVPLPAWTSTYPEDRMAVYDPSTLTSATIDWPDWNQEDPLALPDGSVLVEHLDGTAHRYTFDGTTITSEAYVIADGTPGWINSYGSGGPGESWVFDGTNLWTYNTDCPVGSPCSNFITLGWITFSPC